MDMLTIISTKVRDLYEHHLRLADFIYVPIFPCVTSILFTFCNALLFHLNTVVETVAGTFFLILLGYYYLVNIGSFVPAGKQKALFALLTGFIIFGMHKWEASFTSFFSFAVFFDLCICFFNYFFIVRYIDQDRYVSKKYHIPFLIFSYLLVIFEEPSYFYGYLFSITILLLLIRRFEFLNLNKKRWNQVFILNIVMLLFTVAVTTVLSVSSLFGTGGSDMNLGNFFKTFLQKPLWMIKFYLIASSGPFLGELHTHISLRALAGLFIMIGYGAAIYYVLKKKDKRLLVPLALIFYNIISYGFVTMGRYIFNNIQYGASSRYTAFNLSGVVGIVTILFFCCLEDNSRIIRLAAGSFLIAILAGYLRVDKKQLDISPYRTAAFVEMRKSLLTGNDLEILQNSPSVSLNAINVLEKFHLNVYYGEKIRKRGPISLDKVKLVVLTSGNPYFEDLRKTGFYENENGISWTNGKAAILFDDYIESKDSLVVQLTTFLPPVCKNINPKLTFSDTDNKMYLPARSVRKDNTFYFFFDLHEKALIQRIDILSDTVDASPDKRVLSFPFMSLEIKKSTL